MPTASVHPMVVGRSDALALVQVWAPLEIKWRNKWSTGWADGLRRGIGAIDVLCSRDNASCAGTKPSAPVEPVVRRSIPSVQWRQQKREVQRLVQLLVSDRLNRRYPMQRHRFNRWFAILCWPLVQRLQDLVTYIYVLPQPFEDCWSPKTSHTHPRIPPSHPRA